MDPQQCKRQIMIWYIIAAMFGVLLFPLLWSSYTEVDTIPYSTFEQLLNAGNVAEFTVGTESVEGVLNAPLPSGRRTFYAVRVDRQAADKLSARDVVVVGRTGRHDPVLDRSGTGLLRDLQGRTSN